MKFKCVNETEHFSYEDCQVFNLIDGEGSVTMELEALIVRPENSQNSNYTMSYAGTVYARFAEGRVAGAVREGCRRFDANDVLLEEIPDQNLDNEQTKTLLRDAEGAYLYCVKVEENGSNGRKCVLSIEIPGEDIAGADASIFRIEIECKDVIFEWDRYMNRVQM